MESTRIDTAKLKQAVQEALTHLAQAQVVLSPYLVLLTEQERRDTLRTRESFPKKARDFAREMADHQDLAATAGYDAAAVLEDLDNVDALAPLSSALGKLGQSVDDSKLAWLAEADEPTRAAYQIAKVGARTNAKIAPVVDALASLYATRRARTEKPETPTK